MDSTPTQIETDVIATQCASFRYNDGHSENKKAFLLHKLQLETKINHPVASTKTINGGQNHQIMPGIDR